MSPRIHNVALIVAEPVPRGRANAWCSPPSAKAGATYVIRPGGSGDVTSSHVAWQAAKGAPFLPSPLLYGDELDMINDQAGIDTPGTDDNPSLKNGYPAPAGCGKTTVNVVCPG